MRETTKRRGHNPFSVSQLSHFLILYFSNIGLFTMKAMKNTKKTKHS